MSFLIVKAWENRGASGHQENARFSGDAGRWGASHGRPRGRRGGGTAAGAVRNGIAGRGGRTAMDVYRNAAPHVGTCVVVQSSMTYLSFAHRKPKKISQVFVVRNSWFLH